MQQENNFDLMEENEVSAKSNGGTERIKRQLYNGEIPRELLEKFQIVFSRERELKPDKYRLFYAHDTDGDPEAINALGNGGWQKYHKIIFVSNWQQQRYIERFNIPWSRTIVMQNFIVPIYNHDEKPEKEKDTIRLIYHSTPQRGLGILAMVFNELAKKYDNIELDVFSSFNIYGWDDPKELEGLFNFLRNHPKINYHGAVDNSVIRDTLKKAHIFAYPSIWPETSCICLMEAMSAGLLCVHPNYGALYETASNWSYMYNWHESEQTHAEIFYANLEQAILQINAEPTKVRVDMQKTYTDVFYNWTLRREQWIGLLTAIASGPLEIENPDDFLYL